MTQDVTNNCDYQQTTESLYNYMARNLMRYHGFNVLAFADPSGRRRGLPSWVPDWSVEAKIEPLRVPWNTSADKRIFTASPDADSLVDISSDFQALILKAVNLSMVLVPLPQPGEIPLDRMRRPFLRVLEMSLIRLIQEWCALADKKSESQIRESFRRTLVADCYRHDYEISRLDEPTWARYNAWFDAEERLRDPVDPEAPDAESCGSAAQRLGTPAAPRYRCAS